MAKRVVNRLFLSLSEKLVWVLTRNRVDAASDIGSSINTLHKAILNPRVKSNEAINGSQAIDVLAFVCKPSQNEPTTHI